jgi:hypothetical protein
MDPLSIAVATVSLVKVCTVVGGELKQFINGTQLVNTAVNVLLADIEGFGQTLNVMKTTMEDPNINGSLSSSGHLGNHWANVKILLSDAEKALDSLSCTIVKVDKKVTVMDATRKHIRLKSAAEKIGLYQQQIRSYRDTLQISLQTAVMWQQVASHEATSNVSITLDELQTMIRRLAMDMNQRMASVENTNTSKQPNNTDDDDDDDDDELVADRVFKKPAIENLRNCLRSAASIVSSASTAIGRDIGTGQSTIYGSDFGDVFPPQPSDLMLSWIESNRVDESDEITNSGTARSSTHVSSVKDPEAQVDWDSDEEHDIELAKMILKQGKAKILAGDFEGAERYLENCRGRLIDMQDLPRFGSIIPDLLLDTLSHLITTSREQQKWDDADKLLRQKITLISRHSSRDLSSISDMLALAEVLLEKKEITESLLYARKAYRSSKKQGATRINNCKRALNLLVKVCVLSDKQIEADAYGALLDDLDRVEVSRSFATFTEENKSVQASGNSKSRVQDDWDAMFQSVSGGDVSRPAATSTEENKPIQAPGNSKSRDQDDWDAMMQSISGGEVSRPATTSTEENKSTQASGNSKSRDQDDWDAMMQSISGGGYSGVLGAGESSKSGPFGESRKRGLFGEKNPFRNHNTRFSAPPKAPEAPKLGSTINMTSEHDVEQLRRLMQLGYPRGSSIDALEKYDYDFDKVY